MPKFRTFGIDNTVLIVFFALSLAIGSVIFSIYSSFRLHEDFAELAWLINFDRTLVVFSAGFALVVSLASNRVHTSVEKQVNAFAFVVISAGSVAFGLAFSWPVMACVVLALSLGSVAAYFSNKLTLGSPFSNLLLGVGLYFLFLISVVVYFAADVLINDGGGIILWLFSDDSCVGVNGYFALCAVFIVSSWLLFTDKQEIPALLLVGLSIGLLGPIMFLGCFLPTLIKRLPLEEKAYLLVSGLMGGTVLVLIATINSLAFGGYAPALIVPLGFIGIPTLMWLCRTTKQGCLVSRLEATFILISVLISAVVVWHLADFAARLA